MKINSAIAVLSDEHHLEKTKQVFYSSYKYGNWQGDYILLAHEIPSQVDLSWFDSKGIKIIRTEHLTAHGLARNDKTAVYYSKLRLFSPELSNWKTILYLDTDIIIRKDINHLSEYKSFAAADDCFKYPLSHQFSLEANASKKSTYGIEREECYAELKKRGVNLKQTAFNAGMMVVDSINNSKERYAELMDLVRVLGAYSTYGDQGILNVYFQKNRIRIPYIYNDFYQSDDFNRRGLIGRTTYKDAVMLHLTFPFKPWDERSSFNKTWKKFTLEANDVFANVEQVGKKPSKYSAMKVDFINAYNILKVKAELFIRKVFGT